MISSLAYIYLRILVGQPELYNLLIERNFGVSRFKPVLTYLFATLHINMSSSVFEIGQQFARHLSLG